MDKEVDSLDDWDKMSLANSELGQSARDVKELSDGKSDSDDENDKEGFDNQSSMRFVKHSSRRMSLFQTSEYSIKSHSNMIETVKKNQELMEAAERVNFQSAADTEPLSLINLIKKVKLDTNESILDSALKKERKGLRTWDSIGGVLTLTLILLYVVEYENFATVTEGAQAFSSSPLNHALRVIMLGIAGVICVVQYFHYSYLLRIDKVLKIKDKKETLWSSGYFKFLMLEIFLNGIVCPPKLDSGFDIIQLKGSMRLTYDGVCCLLALTRFYNVLKIPEQYSLWTNEKSTKICKKLKIRPTTSFMIKSEMKRSPYMTIFLCLFCVAILFGIGIRTIEMAYLPGQEDAAKSQFFSSWVSTFFFIFVTMVTVGYGDIYPKTHLGRFVVLWVGVIGTMLVSLMVVALTNSTVLTTGEIRVFNKVDQLSLQNEVKKVASELIYNVFLMYCESKKVAMAVADKVPQEEIDDMVFRRFSILAKCKPIVTDFNSLYHKMKTTTSIPEDLILALLENNEGKFKEAYAKYNKTKYVQQNCEQIRLNQKDMANRIASLTALQHRVAATLVAINLQYSSANS